MYLLSSLELNRLLITEIIFAFITWLNNKCFFFIYVFLSIYPSYFFAFHWSVRDINTLLLTGRLKFQTNHRRWDQRFSYKTKGVIHIRACLQKG